MQDVFFDTELRIQRNGALLGHQSTRVLSPVRRPKTG